MPADLLEAEVAGLARRMAMVDLRDFKTKQILDLPNISSSHGGMFVTPDTKYPPPFAAALSMNRQESTIRDIVPETPT